MYGFHGRLLHIDLSTGKVLGATSRSRVCAHFWAASVSAPVYCTNLRPQESIHSPPQTH